MASHKFYKVYMKELEKNRLKLSNLWEKWDRKDQTRERIRRNKLKILKRILDNLVLAKKDQTNKVILTFEYNYIKYNLIYLFAKNCGSLKDDADLFMHGLVQFKKEGVIKEEEKADIIEMSPLSRWGIF